MTQTLKKHEDKFIHINKYTPKRVLSFMLGVFILSYSIYEAFTITASKPVFSVLFGILLGTLLIVVSFDKESWEKD